MQRTIPLIAATLVIGMSIGAGAATVIERVGPSPHQQATRLRSGPVHALPGISPSAAAQPTPSSEATAQPTASAQPAQPESPSEVVVGHLSIPAIGISEAPIYDRGTDGRGSMAIARGYAVTHFQSSATFGAGNTVLYGHDDIEGSVFARLKDLRAGDVIRVALPGAAPQVFVVNGKKVIAPTAVQILAPTRLPQLTLFTCWPNLVDTQRIVVTALPG
ncbi:MAG: sortase [Candidatus Dormibacteraeota bacterium]|nr:sortase [Candidatus Dormibacteraeota bacterium]